MVMVVVMVQPKTVFTVDNYYSHGLVQSNKNVSTSSYDAIPYVP